MINRSKDSNPKVTVAGLDESKNYGVLILTLSGKKVSEESVSDKNVYEWQPSEDIAPGIYWVIIREGEKIVYRGKLVIVK